MSLKFEVIRWKDLDVGDAVSDGNFAVVHKGSYKGEVVAIKKWRMQDFSERDLELFKREVDANSLFSHTNIVKFIGACVEPICIVTEFVDGRDLWETVHDDRVSYTWADVKRMAVTTASGMNHIHQKKQIHRDLKSLNLLITKTFDVKICDFGLARFIARAAKLTGGCGTVQWMAPEVILHGEYNEKVDIFSYGIVLWEMCTRLAPYAEYGNQEIKIASAVAYHNARPEIPAYVPTKIAQMIQTCWALEPEKRPSFTEILQIWEDPAIIPAEMLTQKITQP